MPRETTAKRPNSRERLIDVACALMHRRGFSATSVDEIVREAGVSKGNFFHHFKSKEALGFAVIERFRDLWSAMIADVVSMPGLRPLERFDHFFGFLVDHFREQNIEAGCPCGVLAQELSGLHEGYRTHLAGIFRMMEEAWTDLLDESRRIGELHPGVDTVGLAEFLVADMQGAILLMKTQRDIARLERHFAHTREYLYSLRAL